MRYDGAGTAPALYLIEVGDLIKVGRSVMPHCRLRELHTKSARRGMAMGRFQTFPMSDRVLSWRETDCIKALAAIATSRPSIRSEYFQGISFEQAIAVVQAVLRTTSEVSSMHTIKPITSLTREERRALAQAAADRGDQIQQACPFASGSREFDDFFLDYLKRRQANLTLCE